MPLDLFNKTPIPDKLPTGMQKIIEMLKKSASEHECLCRAYQTLAKKYRGYHFKTYTLLPKVFTNDIEKLWNKEGFLHCSNINYLLRILLLKSDFFTGDDIKIRWTLIWYISPHQYLQVKINDEWMNVDIWSHVYGIKLGDYAHGFH